MDLKSNAKCPLISDIRRKKEKEDVKMEAETG